MNTKLLKQKILDLAIRGKLTQQLKSDGTAADLLKEISSAGHPERSAKGTKLKDPGTIIPLDKSEAPFEIPENWEWVRLGDVAYIASGSTPSKDCFVESGVPYLKMYNLRNQQIDFEYKPQYIKREIHEGKLARSKAKPGDVIMNIVGPPLGKVALVPESLPECNFNQAAVLIRSHFCTNLMNQYIRYFLLQMDEINAINTKGTAGQENISLTQTQNMRFPLPPLAEQQRIVEKIQEAFAEIDSIENNKELLKKHIKQARQKILDLAIHGRLVPQNKNDEPASVLLERITRDNPHYEKLEDEPFEIPENWAWCRLGNLSESIQYGYNAPAKDSGRIKMVRISDIHENEVEWDSVPYCDIDDKEIQTYLLKKNDILFARTGGTVGKSFIVSNLPEDAVYAGYLIRTRYGKNANAQYMKYFMESNLYWEQLRDGCIATAQPNCNGKTLGKMQIPLPPLAEQSRIVAKIKELFYTLDQMERNLV
ncbi:MAG: restriction endonuclease subunit S [Fibrobacter sp.]|nr:restriction endonuclease subunit S [Fibrobacter sp.]